uniref:Uncharacterized protein n=1 Tax=Amphiprion percula TaxID=161767 RepID=A0A3P8SGA7_AMPPE
MMFSKGLHSAVKPDVLLKHSLWSDETMIYLFGLNEIQHVCVLTVKHRGGSAKGMTFIEDTLNVLLKRTTTCSGVKYLRKTKLINQLAQG